MTEPIPEPVTPEPVEPVVADDPRKPFKALAGFVVAFLGALAVGMQGDNELESFNDWWPVIVAAAVTALGVYFTPNPKIAKTTRRRV